MKKRNVFRIAVIVSLALHASLALVVWVQPKILIREPTIPQRTEIELVDAAEILKQMREQQTRGQIVTQDQRLNDEIPQDSKYLSKFNQRVEKETRAELNDRFRNSTGAGGPQAQQATPGEAEKIREQTLSDNAEKRKDPKTEQKRPKQVYTSPDGIASDRSLQDFKPDFRPKPQPMGTQARGGGDGPSATDDHLKDVAKGMQTLLSTREFVYYSYYNRIKERLRQYWEPKIKEKLERVMRQGRTIASDVDRITKCVIILDSSGTLVRVQIVGASGLVDLDDAAVEAFRAAAPFPNPPEGIVEQDGLIRIRWDFILEASRSGPFQFDRYAAVE